MRGVLARAADVNVVDRPGRHGQDDHHGRAGRGMAGQRRQVLGLALSQTAANELAAATGARGENIAKLLWETRRIDPEHLPRSRRQMGDPTAGRWSSWTRPA